MASIPTLMLGKPTHKSCRRPDRYGPKLDFNDECEAGVESSDEERLPTRIKQLSRVSS